MPRVPVPSFSDARAPTALPGPMQNPGIASPNNFGAQLGDALQNSADMAGLIYQRAKHDADQSAVTAAAAKGQNTLNDVVLNPDPNGTGYYRLKGEDALAARQPTLDAVDKQLSEISNSLTRDQQAMWQHVATSIRDAAIHHIDAHEAQQIAHVDAANTKGAADALSRSLQMPGIIGDPQQVQDTLDKLDAVLTAGAKRQLGQSASADAIRSVTSPIMQTAAMDGMNAAVASQDPSVAKAALDKLGPLLGVHERLYAGAVQRMTATKEIGTAAGTIIGSAMTKVAMPDGGETVRVDAGKVLSGVAGIAPDNPLRDQTEAEVQKRHHAYDAAWGNAVAQVKAGALTAGTNPADGKFDIGKVSPAALEWLRQNAPDKLIELGKEDARAQRVASGEDKRISSEYRSLVSADLHNPATWADTYAKMTPQQFLTFLSDDKQFPNGWQPGDRVAVQKDFQSLQANASKLEEPVGRTVKDQIADAFRDDEFARKAFERGYFGKLQDKANAFVAGEKAAGRKVDTEDVRKFIDSWIVTVPSGHWYQPDRRRITLDPASALQAPQPPPTAAATPVAAPQKGFAGYRYTPDRKTRYPADAQGNVLGPGEPVP